MQVGPTLQEGSSGEAVKELQRALQRAGFDPGPIDGEFGPVTAAAVRSFQAAKGLVVDGIVGPQTWSALPSEDEGVRPTLQEGSSGEAVEELQRALQRAGFDPGPIDGEFGPVTAAAVRSFQAAKGLVVDGIVGPQTWSALLGEEEVVLHIKVLQQPNIAIDTMLENMRQVYSTANIRVADASLENLEGPNFAALLDVDVGPCNMGQAMTTEQTQLFGNRNSVGANEIAVYFVRSVLKNNAQALNGCASFPTNQPSCVVAQIASPWTLAHEVGHVLGLAHISGEDTNCPTANPHCCSTPDFSRLMTGCGTGNITGTPTLSQGEIDTMIASNLTIEGV